jgi:hypothetical protein
MEWLAEELRRIEITFKGERSRKIINHLKEGMVKSFE